MDYLLREPLGDDGLSGNANAVVEDESGAWLAEWDGESVQKLCDVGGDYVAAHRNWRTGAITLAEAAQECDIAARKVIARRFGLTVGLDIDDELMKATLVDHGDALGWAMNIAKVAAHCPLSLHSRMIDASVMSEIEAVVSEILYNAYANEFARRMAKFAA